MDAYLGEIRIFCGTFAPAGWMDCMGQILPISRNTALFSLLGTMYGGDGKVTFALPDLRGCVPISQGTGPGLTPRSVGETGGAAAVALTPAEMPMHNHRAQGAGRIGTANTPKDGVWSEFGTDGRPPVLVPLFGATGDAAMHPQALTTAGQGKPHNNMQPFTAVRFIICTNGIFPPRPS